MRFFPFFRGSRLFDFGSFARSSHHADEKEKKNLKAHNRLPDRIQPNVGSPRCAFLDVCVQGGWRNGKTKHKSVLEKIFYISFFNAPTFIYLTTTSDDRTKRRRRKKKHFLGVFSKEQSTTYNEKYSETLVVLCLR